MSSEDQCERIQPAILPTGNAVSRPWVFVLSDWQAYLADLVAQVRLAVSRAHEGRSLATILVVDDLGSPQAEHRFLLAQLTEAGAIILEANDEEEATALQTDPFTFAQTQYSSIARQLVRPATAVPSPSQEDGYQEFGRAFTQLSPEQLEAIIEGRLPPGNWRYES